ncbi:MAG: hypothetical protein M3Y42_04275 [Actinomycetota bacterium]|nr:hypothetical protein [Actinomycetota bacterium]MDQ2956163.1 hypothetical protein [Actinomycetota bacterium]
MTASASSSDRTAEVARSLLSSPELADSLVRSRGVIGQPIPVLRPDNQARQAWFVPVTVADLLAGFLVLGLDNVLRRWSSFQRRPDSIEGCPAAADWLSAPTILDRARTAGADGKLGTPYLSYDCSPDRIAWIVPAGAQQVYVAGTTSWLGR